MGWTFIKTLLRWLCRALFRVRVNGDLSVLTQPRTLIVANHQSFLDGLLLALFLPVQPVFVVDNGAAIHPLIRSLLKLANGLVIDVNQPMVLRKILKLVDSGCTVVFFPEGRITVTGTLMKIYDGPALIAARTGAVIVPVCVDGAARSYFGKLPCTQPRRLFPVIRISVLPATRIAIADLPNGQLRRKQAVDALQAIMQNMMFACRPRQTLWQAYAANMSAFGPRRTVIEDIRQTPLSYRALLKLSLAIARIAVRGTGAGERVGVLLPNIAPTVGAILGLSALNRVAAMINYTAGQQSIISALKVAGVRVILTSRAFLEKADLTKIVQNLTECKLIYLEDLRHSLAWNDKLWLLAASILPRLMLSVGEPEAAAVVLFTSGSEGKPKGVVLSHHALLSNIAQIQVLFDIQPADKVFNALPMFHSLGLTAGTLLPILSGMKVFLYPSPLHYRVIPELVYSKDCTILYGTSTFLGNYAKFAHPYDFYRLRYVVAGAEKLSDSVREFWLEKFGIRILEGYGVTEASAVLAVNTPMAFKKDSVGRILPGIGWRIDPVPGITRGGMLSVSGPNLMTGYLCAEQPGIVQPSSATLGAGWHETGDIVEADEQGFIRILGRLKRFAKIAGEMVSLETTEIIATLASPGNQHAAVTQTDIQRGEAIVLYTTDSHLNRERLHQQAKISGYPDIAVPRKIIHIDALPLLGTGKVDYLRLNQWGQDNG